MVEFAYLVVMTAIAYEAGTTRLFEQLVNPGDVVFDVGVHAGYYTRLAARLVGPTGSIYAFEPEPENPGAFGPQPCAERPAAP